ncbi:serine/threonine protein kinase [Nannocystis radixulma]|uniref:Serine/threonine-protein kinase n=1 Tax=Nannocystis radixulma TaxID=2995305 RepID=A0ABT5BB70_9BACT|nr:serine/threonine-protein kinase [Nannocystis radixulma]MDC0670983.1 serine/threonine-protein kinase [Nannocystis radixulma]
MNVAASPLPNPDAPPTAWIGHTLDGRYHLRDLLGEGGMGAVFTAEHLNLRKLVAVKMIHAEYTGNEEIAERFRREAMATAQIEHPNVASAIDFGPLPGGGAYLVTQLVRGSSLTDIIARGRLRWQQTCDIGAQIADALTAAHAIGIVHRDLKPDNILLEPREDGEVVKVLDFGIARVAGASTGTEPLTRLGTVMGTPGYMAPEQAMGEPTDHRTDLYALGVILWECLSGRALWDGGEMSDLLTRQLTQAPPSLAGEVVDLPIEFERLIQQLLAREAKQRPQTAREVRDALRALGRSVGAVPVATVPPPNTIPPAPPPAAPNRGLTGFIAVFVGAAVLIVVLWAIRQPGGEDPPPAEDGERPAEFVPAAGKTAAEPGANDESKGAGPSGPVPSASKNDLGELPEGLRGPATTLLAEERSGHFKAAEAVLAYEPEVDVPLWLHGLALLEKAESCEAKRAAVKRIAEANDKRGLPALQRLNKTPRKGCGIFKSNDCLECLRLTLKKSIDQLAALP